MRMSTEAGALARAGAALRNRDLARHRGRVGDLIGLIIEATGLQVEIGEVCMVGDGRDRPPVSTEVVGFRGGRTLLMPLGELHGIGPGTVVQPTGAAFRVGVGEPLLGRVIDGLGVPLDGLGEPDPRTAVGHIRRLGRGQVLAPGDDRALHYG